MDRNEIVNKTMKFVKSKFENEGTGHDWWHIQRVLKTALKIGKEENADLYIVQLASLLHDIADHKFHGGDYSAGGKAAREYLKSQGVEIEVIDHVCLIIDALSFKGAGAEMPMVTSEGRIVRDADRLDALGAIGIARCFAYGGSKNRPIHDPETKYELHKTKEEYANRQGTSLNHFYEKLLLLKDLMLTDAGRRMAEERHEFMKNFLERFYNEWNGEA